MCNIHTTMIQVEQTPNPDSLKFLSQKILSKVGTEEFRKSIIKAGQDTDKPNFGRK